jgi:betaine reductase
MKDAVPTVANLAKRLAAGETIGSAEEEGYLPRHRRKNVRAGRSGAARAIDLLLAKLDGDVRTEVEPSADRVAPPPPVRDLAAATIALVTEAGCVPQGNPDHLPTRHANVWLRYPLDGVESLSPEAYVSVHAGFDTTYANLDPNRLVPLDAVRELEHEGRIGALHGKFYTTTGVDTPVATAVKFGQEIAAELKSAEVSAVILTGT